MEEPEKTTDLEEDIPPKNEQSVDQELEAAIQDTQMLSVVRRWRDGLEILVLLYEIYRPRTSRFTLRIFCFFVCTNIFCYWLALSTAFPYLLVSYKANEYFWMQIPVGILGASFDTASFFITVWIAKNAINSTKNWIFALHLSLDLVIAFLATMWVVLVFVVSGWAMSYILGNPEQLSSRSNVYHGRLLQALLFPFENIRNIYFGLIMGISAALPSCVHFLLFLRATISLWFSTSAIEEFTSEDQQCIPEEREFLSDEEEFILEEQEEFHTELLVNEPDPTKM